MLVKHTCGNHRTQRVAKTGPCPERAQNSEGHRHARISKSCSLTSALICIWSDRVRAHRKEWPGLLRVDSKASVQKVIQLIQQLSFPALLETYTFFKNQQQSKMN